MAGSAPSARQRLLARLVADHPLKVAHERRIGRRPDHRADDVVGRAHVGDPVPDRRADGLLQRPRTRLDRHHLGPEQAHALDVRRLAAHVLGAHVDDALESSSAQAVAVATPCCPAPVSAITRALPHPAGEQRLTDRVVDLVGAGVGEVLALQVDPAADPLREPVGAIKGRRPPHVVAKQGVELGPELRVLAGVRPCRRELVEGRDQDLGDVAPPVGAESLLDRLAAARSRHSTRAPDAPLGARPRRPPSARGP